MREIQASTTRQQPFRGFDAAPHAERSSAHRLFQIYNGYRLVVSIVLLAMLLSPQTRELVGTLNPKLHLLGSGLMLLSSLVLYGGTGRRIRRGETGIFAIMLVDIVATTLIANASGGLVSGFSVLYVITVSAAAMLLRTRILATLVAALAVLALLADTLHLIARDELLMSMTLPAGVLGSLLFTVSLLMQTVVRRLESAEAQVDAVETRVIELQALNTQIIGHMQMGILLVGRDGSARPINAAAQRLLQLNDREPRNIVNVHQTLAVQFQEWLAGVGQRPEPFASDEGAPNLIASFAKLDEAGGEDTLIFIDDYTPVTQYAQSLKLNSLGKLTASIAHEIRNPLSAISHASQLLTESDELDAADRKLCDIVTNNAKRVNDIIENVMQLSRRAPPDFQRLEMGNWIREMLRQYCEGRTEAGPIALAGGDLQANVKADPAHLTRVIGNLLDNALRHSAQDTSTAGARVVLSEDLALGEIHIDIIDFGNGVPKANETRLFEPFFTTSSEGSGLGLYLCKELCEINGAGLVYRRTESGESCFRVSLALESTTG